MPAPVIPPPITTTSYAGPMVTTGRYHRRMDVRHAACTVAVVAACWSASPPAPTPPKPRQPDARVPEPPALIEIKATLRIDAKSGGKKLQGVWLELEPGKRWVIDDRPRELWRSFEDADV